MRLHFATTLFLIIFWSRAYLVSYQTGTVHWKSRSRHAASGQQCRIGLDKQTKGEGNYTILFFYRLVFCIDKKNATFKSISVLYQTRIDLDKKMLTFKSNSVLYQIRLELEGFNKKII